MTPFLHNLSVEVAGCVQVAGKHLLQGSVADVVALVARELWEVKRRGIVEEHYRQISIPPVVGIHTLLMFVIGLFKLVHDNRPW